MIVNSGLVVKGCEVIREAIVKDEAANIPRAIHLYKIGIGMLEIGKQDTSEHASYSLEYLEKKIQRYKDRVSSLEKVTSEKTILEDLSFLFTFTPERFFKNFNHRVT